MATRLTGPVTIFAPTHSGALSNAQGAQLGASLNINAKQWHETLPQIALPATAPTLGGTMHLPSAFGARPIIEAPHPLAPTHVIVTGNKNNPIKHFNPRLLV